MLEALVQTKPQDPEIQSALGMLYADQKQPDKAVPHIEAALALGRKTDRVLADAGEAYESMGNRALALRYLQESLKAGETLDGLRTRPQPANGIERSKFPCQRKVARDKGGK